MVGVVVVVGVVNEYSGVQRISDILRPSYRVTVLYQYIPYLVLLNTLHTPVLEIPIFHGVTLRAPHLNGMKDLTNVIAHLKKTKRSGQKESEKNKTVKEKNGQKGVRKDQVITVEIDVFKRCGEVKREKYDVFIPALALVQALN